MDNLTVAFNVALHVFMMQSASWQLQVHCVWAATPHMAVTGCFLT